MMKIIVVTIMAMVAGALDGEVKVTGIEAQQRYPEQGCVDIAVMCTGESNEVAEAKFYFIASNCVAATMINVSHLESMGTDIRMVNPGTDSGEGKGTNYGKAVIWRRNFEWNAAADVGEVQIEDVALSVDVDKYGGVQLWENGPFWAECNVGATKPEEHGYYFWWGDTVGYKLKTWVNGGDGFYYDVKWISSKGIRMSSSPFDTKKCPTYGKSNAQLCANDYIDSSGNLMAKHDAATAHLGVPWRMPTSLEIDALISNCSSTWMTSNGVCGRLVTGNGVYASRSIFLPAAGFGEETFLDYSLKGCYWSSSIFFDFNESSRSLFFHSSEFDWCYDNRSIGLSVRPLRGSSQANFQTTHLSLDCTQLATEVKFLDSDGSELRSVSLLRDAVYRLPPCEATPPDGKRFAGWMGSNGKRYDDGVVVFNLASGGAVTMTAIWE